MMYLCLHAIYKLCNTMRLDGFLFFSRIWLAFGLNPFYLFVVMFAISKSNLLPQSINFFNVA